MLLLTTTPRTARCRTAYTDLTFAITTKTTVTLNGNATNSNSRGVVKFRALKNMTNSGLLTALRPDHMRAFQVIDQGR